MNASKNPLATILPADMSRLADIERTFLNHLSQRQSVPYRREEFIASLLLSAVLFGGLVCQAHWQRWADAMCKLPEFDVPHEIFFYVERRKRWWIPDPISLSLCRSFVRMRRVPEPSSRVTDELDALLRLMGADVTASRLGDLAAARLHLSIPGILAEHASGRLVAYGAEGIKDEPVDRNIEFIAGLIGKNMSASTGIGMMKSNFTHSYLRYFNKALSIDFRDENYTRHKSIKHMRCAIDEQIRFWRKINRSPIYKNIHPSIYDTVHVLVLFWLLGRASSVSKGDVSLQSYVGPSTIRKYVKELDRPYFSDKFLIMRLCGADPIVIEQEFKVFVHGHLNEDAKPLPRSEERARIIRSFTEFLRGLSPEIPSFKIERKDKVKRYSPSPSPPRSLVSDKQFQQVLSILRSVASTAQGHSGLPEVVRLARERHMWCLAATMLFRAGLRARELCSLTISDLFFFGDHAELIVRGGLERANKTIYSRRRIPLDVFLSGDELKDLRQWHAIRVAETQACLPNAKLFADPNSKRSMDQSRLIEPIDLALKHVLRREHSTTYAGSQEWAFEKRREAKGYWYSLCTEFRHSFASYLFATLLLPADKGACPALSKIEPSLVSYERKARIAPRLLPAGQIGLTVMQAIRRIMGHAGYGRAVKTYIHLADQMLAVHMWRQALQLPLNRREAEAIGLGSGLSVQSSRTAVGERRRTLEHLTSIDSTMNLDIRPRQRPRRGRPGDCGVRQYFADLAAPEPRVSTKSSFTIANDDDENLPARQAVPLPFSGKTAEMWQAIDVVIEARRKGLFLELVAERLQVDVDICKQWADSFERIAGVRVAGGKFRYSEGSSEARVSALPLFRFPEDDRKIIDDLWCKRPSKWKRSELTLLQTYLAATRGGERTTRSKIAAERHRQYLIGLGVAADSIRTTEKEVSRGAGPDYRSKSTTVYKIWVASKAERHGQQELDSVGVGLGCTAKDTARDAKGQVPKGVIPARSRKSRAFLYGLILLAIDAKLSSAN